MERNPASVGAATEKKPRNVAAAKSVVVVGAARDIMYTNFYSCNIIPSFLCEKCAASILFNKGAHKMRFGIR